MHATAMIFAAGEGRRMRPLTLTQPKPLLPLAGKPLIVYWLERLALAGVGRVVINTGYLGHQLPAALGDGRLWGLEILYSHEQPPLETGGGLLQALPLLTEDGKSRKPFWLVNGDVWCSPLPPLSSLRLSAQESLGQLLLVPNPEQHPEGDFYYDPDTGWLYNGPHDHEPHALLAIPPSKTRPRYTFSGMSVLHPDSLDPKHLTGAYGRTPAVGSAFPLAPLLRHLVAQRRLSGQVYSGQWVDVGTPARLKALEAQVSSCHRKPPC